MTIIDTDRRYRPRSPRDVILFMLALYAAARRPHSYQETALDLIIAGVVAAGDTAKCWS